MSGSKTHTQASCFITKETKITSPDTNPDTNPDTKSPNTREKSKIQDNTTKASDKKNNGMTPENAKAIHILKTKGSEKAVEYMFNPTGERQLSYAEMRSMFG